MIQKIKSGLSSTDFNRQLLMRCIAVISAVTIGALTLLGCMIRIILISDGSNNYRFFTINGNVSSYLQTASLKSNSYNITNMVEKNNVTKVKIEYTFPVYVTCGSSTLEITTGKSTVRDILSALDITIDEHDMIEPPVDTLMCDTAYIDYVDIDYVDGSYSETIPCQLKTVYSALHAKNTSVIENGTDGVRVVSYTEKRVNGEAVESVVTGSTVVAEPVDGTKIIGTKQAAAPVKAAVRTSADVSSVSTLTPSSPIELDASGIPVSYKKHITARATAYTYTGHNTATGVAPQPGYIAVNPNVIPYGTRMYIRTADGNVIYGYAVAADTGGFIRKYPNGVDLFYSSRSACISFGVRNVEIYILD